MAKRRGTIGAESALRLPAPEHRASCDSGPVTPTRLVSIDDASALADLVSANRGFLAPFEPVRGEEYFTLEGQSALIQTQLQQHELGLNLPHVILDSGRVVGRITLSGIVRGPLQSAHLGYWVNATDGGRGLATAAVRNLVQIAFQEWGLHRIEAGTLLDNVRS